MENLFPFFLVLFAGVFFSNLFRRLHLPWVIALILGGIIIGPHGAGFFETNETVDFIGDIGLIFLMFMAGLETKFSGLKEYKGNIFTLSVINGGVPFLVGMGIGVLFDFSITTSFLIGIIFVSSSIAVVVPTLEDRGLINTKIGKLILGTSIVEDVASLILLSIFLQVTSPSSNVPLPILYGTLFALLVGFRWLLPKIQWFFIIRSFSGKGLF